MSKDRWKQIFRRTFIVLIGDEIPVCYEALADHAFVIYSATTKPEVAASAEAGYYQ